jgi:hypothetical protein
MTEHCVAPERDPGTDTCRCELSLTLRVFALRFASCARGIWHRRNQNRAINHKEWLIP